MNLRHGSWPQWIIGLALSFVSATTMADAVAVVSVKSTIASLNKNQVTEIFLGKVSRLPDGARVVPIDQEDGARVRDEFYDRVAGKTPAQIRAYWSKIIFTGRGQPPATVASSAEMKKRITENPLLIGYIDRSLVDDTLRVVF